MKRLKKTLVLLFCYGHAGMLLLSILPQDGRPIRRPRWIDTPVESLRSLTGTGQKWIMFDTVFTMHSLDVYVSTDDGRELGAALPGLERELLRERPRLIIAFARINQPAHRMIHADWIAAIARSLAGTGARTFTVHYEREHVRHLFHAQRDGILYKTISESRGPFPVPAER